MNKLYFGDNLEILSKRIDSQSVDLVYLDPPFNSQARYNVLFKSPKEDVASAQAAAFVDFWAWGYEAERAYDRIMRDIGGTTATFVQALRSALGESDMMAYLVMMAVRLYELRRVLKPTGSLYLHCDPTASHYLKILLDGIFGASCFINEVSWRRTTAKADHAQGARHFPRVRDVILRYVRNPNAKYTYHQPFRPYDEEYINSKYRLQDADGRRYQLDNLTGPGGASKGNARYEVMGITRYWRYSRERMADLIRAGRVVQPSPGAVPRYKRYLDEMPGVPVSEDWDDIRPLNSQAKERIGYPTQKPLALLDRIIRASSNEGDVVLDPFCGCGTTIHAAESARRQWIGIDVSIHAIHVIEERMREAFGPKKIPTAIGIPADYESAAALAKNDPFQFQWWANYLLGVHVLNEVKKGADRGIDGELFFPNGPGRPYGKLLTFVKAGKNIDPKMVREFRGVIEREQAEMGLFVCLDQPTRSMETEAVVAGYADVVHGRIPRLQIVSVADWFRGHRPIMPPLEQLPYAAFSRPQKGQRVKRPDPAAPELPLSFKGGKKADVVVLNRHLNPLAIAAE